MTIQDPTQERMDRAGEDSYLSETGLRTFKDEPLQRLAARGKLDPNEDINARLFQAGARYFENYYLSNMSPLASFDPTRVFSGGGESGGGMPMSERQAIARSAHREAVGALTGKPKGKELNGVLPNQKYLKVVDRIVLQFQGDLVAVGREACGLANPDVCRQVAIERLVAGLWLLAGHYGMVGRQ